MAGPAIAAILVSAALFGQCTSSARDRCPGRTLRNLTDSHTRVVWCQDLGDGLDVYAERRGLRLMGLDSDDNLGERPILNEPWNYARPMITPKGDRVIFSSRADDTVYIVNWDGSGKRGLVEGFGLDVWRDPDDGTEWLYYAKDARRTGRHDEPKYSAVARCPIDDPSRGELVWNLLPITQLSENNFQISGDGRRASQHGPDICVVNELPNRKWTRYGKGCWPSIAPDNSYRFWHFDGNHRSITMYDPGATNRRTINLNEDAGIGGREVFHPRWSNHARVLAMAGPKLVPGGGPQMEVYVGRFDEAFTTVEEWARITYNSYGDFCPDVWVASALDEPLAPPPVAADGGGRKGLTWPSNRGGLVFLWANRAEDNQIASPAGDRICRVQQRGRAKFGRHFEMDAAGGYLVAESGADELLEAARAKGAVTLEAVIKLAAAAPDGGFVPAVSFGPGDGAPNFAVGVVGRALVLRVRVSDAAEPKEIALGGTALGRPTHVFVNMDRNGVACFVNGARVAVAADAGADFRAWRPGELVFGDRAGRWNGTIEGVAIYARRTFMQEAVQNHALYSPRLQGRGGVPRAVVRARLVEASKLPTPESISPYRAAMAGNVYEVVEVLEGRFEARKFIGAHWAVMDGRVLDDAARAPGAEFRMTVEPFGEHPELEGERLVTDSEDFELPVYYQVGN